MASYTWMGRELRKITNGSNTYSYKYNADGIRTSKTVNSTTTEFSSTAAKFWRKRPGTALCAWSKLKWTILIIF